MSKRKKKNREVVYPCPGCETAVYEMPLADGTHATLENDTNVPHRCSGSWDRILDQLWVGLPPERYSIAPPVEAPVVQSPFELACAAVRMDVIAKVHAEAASRSWHIEGRGFRVRSNTGSRSFQNESEAELTALRRVFAGYRAAYLAQNPEPPRDVRSAMREFVAEPRMDALVRFVATIYLNAQRKGRPSRNLREP